MRIDDTEIAGIRLVTPQRFGDHRGFFAETYNARIFAEAGIDAVFIQDNHSLSRTPGTIRGLHFQLSPFAQAKLVQVVHGAIYDVAVDLRRASPTFGRHYAAMLSAANGRQLYIPMGFAHGFCTTEPDTEVLYKVSSQYAPSHERCLSWDDPDLGISWPVAREEVLLSAKDKDGTLLADLADCFP